MISWRHTPAFLILLAHFTLFYILNFFIGPHPDMLDHWVWSRFLSLSYYEHPPMVALAIRLITLIAGHSEMALEVGAQLYNLFIIALAYALAFRFFGRTAALVSLVMLISTLYYSLGSVFLHIDQPFLICWIINLYFLCRFHQTQSPKWLILIGIVAGFGALSKYITLLFYMGLFLHLLIYKQNRRHLLNPWLYVAGIISLLIFSPVLIWNFQNDWVSFRFQFGRGMAGAPFGKNILNFTFGHLILFSPVWSWWLFWHFWKKRTEYRQGTHPESVIMITALFPLAFFTLMSFRGAIADPHWANVSYLGLMILAGKDLQSSWKDKKYLYMFVGGLLVNFLIIALMFTHIQSPLVDTRQYRLKNHEYLQFHGIPDETIEKLVSVKKHFFDTEKFLQQVRSVLSPEEFEKYQSIIIKAAFKADGDPTHRILAWKQTATQIQDLLASKGIPFPEFIVSREFQLSGALSFYMPGYPWPRTIGKRERNQWSPLDKVQQGNTILVCNLPHCDSVLEDYYEYFDVPVENIGEVITESNGRIVRTLEVYLLKR